MWVSGSIHSFIGVDCRFLFEDRYSCPPDQYPNRRLLNLKLKTLQLKTTCHVTSAVDHEASGNFSCFVTCVTVKPQHVIYYVTRSLHESS